MSTRDHALSVQLCTVALLAPAAMSAYAVAYDLVGGKLTVKGSFTLGAAWRTVSPDSNRVARVNSSLVGVPSNTPTDNTGRNQDDGNLNSSKHDPVSQVVNGYLSLEYKAGDYSALASVKAWYDYTLEDADHPWGNIP